MPDTLLIALSQVADGSMSASVTDEQRLAHRTAFLQTHNVTASQTVLVHLTYDGEDYRRYFTISSDQSGDGIISASTLVSDALFTNEKNVALLLPVADCIGAVLYDPARQVIGLAHLGRHNLIQSGGSEIIEYMRRDFGTNPATVQVWLSPAAGREHYPLYDFDNRSLHEVAMQQLMSAGVTAANITRDARDTTLDPQLFSHSQFLQASQSIDGRQAVVCMMRP
ncbi:MAG: polyphenol oxidase family protein [Patescibacteria group bacterium]